MSRARMWRLLIGALLLSSTTAPAAAQDGSEEFQTVIATVYTTPPDILEKARQAMAAK